MSTKSNGAVSTVIAVVVALAVAGTGGYMAGSRIGENRAAVSSDAVATFKGGKITKAQLYDRMSKQGGDQVASQLIDEELVKAEAQKAGITVTDADVTAEINKLKERMGGEEGFKAALAQEGMSEARVRQIYQFQVTVTRILGKDVKVDDEILKKHFEDNVVQYDIDREVHSQHILMKTEEEAKAIKAELDKGADFNALAKEKSTDPTAKDNGGDLGFNKTGKMDPQFDQVVFKLKKGEVSQPFQSQFGWHVAKVVDIKSLVTFEAVKNKVKDDYVQSQAGSKAKEWLAGLRTKAEVKNTLAPAPASK